MKPLDVLLEWKTTYPSATKVLTDKYVIIDKHHICMIDFDANLDTLIDRGLLLSDPYNYIVGLISDKDNFCIELVEDK